MPMQVAITINGGRVANVDIFNRTVDPTAPVHTYEWEFEEGERRLADTLHHCPEDGAVVLAAKVLVAVATRYEIARQASRHDAQVIAIRRGEEKLAEHRGEEAP